ncbi:MAG: DUF6272 family protein [Cyanobacteria bacterium P01_H01_bin.15]
MSQIFGDFIEISALSTHEFLQIGFSPTTLPIQERWRNNGLSADFVADYLSTFFPGSKDNPEARRRHNEIKGAVSFIANELLENSMKHNYEPANQPVGFRLDLLQADQDIKVVLSARNSVSPENFESFRAFVTEFLNSDPEEFYLSQLEKSAEEDSSASGLGLISMRNDYGAQLGWKFESADLNTNWVTTMIQLIV